jgi:hypothetical protein
VNASEVYILRGNDMRSAKFESRSSICTGTREELDALIVRECVRPWRDGGWHKSFRAGGPLEWFNSSTMETVPLPPALPKAVEL